MKLKLIVGSVVLLLIAGAVITVLRKKENPALKQANPTGQKQAEDPPKAVGLSPDLKSEASSAASPSTPEKEKKISQIEEAKVTYEAAHLPEITGYLNDADPAVRESALDALTQMGLSEAVPALKSAAESTHDPEFRKKCEKLAEFLALPTVELSPTKVKHAATGQDNSSPEAEKKRRHF